MEWFYIIECDNIFDKKKAIMGSLLGINFYNFLCWMAEQTLGTQIWHCTSHVALYKSRGTNSLISPARHEVTAVLLLVPVICLVWGSLASCTQTKLKRGQQLRPQVRCPSNNRTDTCVSLVTIFMMQTLCILVWKRRVVKHISAAHWNIAISGIRTHLNYCLIFIVLHPVCWKPMW